MHTNENALQGQGAKIIYSNKISRHYTTKKYPAYGKKLKKLRDLGRAPCGDVVIVFDWNIAKFCNRIVIPDNKPASNFIFDYLAGLNIMIAYSFDNAHLLPDLINELLKVNPSILVTFNYELAKNNFLGSPATCLIYQAKEAT